MFKDTRVPKKNAVEALAKVFQWAGIVYEDCIGNIGHLRAAVTEVKNVQVFQQVIRKRSLVSVRHVAA